MNYSFFNRTEFRPAWPGEVEFIREVERLWRAEGEPEEFASLTKPFLVHLFQNRRVPYTFYHSVRQKHPGICSIPAFEAQGAVTDSLELLREAGDLCRRSRGLVVQASQMMDQHPGEGLATARMLNALERGSQRLNGFNRGRGSVAQYIGARLEARRVAEGLTVDEVAEALGGDEWLREVRRVEQGHSHMDLGLACALSAFYGEELFPRPLSWAIDPGTRRGRKKGGQAGPAEKPIRGSYAVPKSKLPPVGSLVLYQPHGWNEATLGVVCAHNRRNSGYFAGVAYFEGGIALYSPWARQARSKGEFGWSLASDEEKQRFSPNLREQLHERMRRHSILREVNEAVGANPERGAEAPAKPSVPEHGAEATAKPSVPAPVVKPRTVTGLFGKVRFPEPAVSLHWRARAELATWIMEESGFTEGECDLARRLLRGVRE